MPYQFTNEEYADMVFVYGACEGNAARAEREYAVRFPNRRTPCRTTIMGCFASLRETGAFPSANVERVVTRRNNADAVLREVNQDPRTSQRRISAATGQNKTAIHVTLHENGYHPYHFQSVQNLLPQDYAVRRAFCNWILAHQDIVPLILFCDEATFTRDGINNLHNEHIWAIENPHAISENRFQHRFSANVWGGIIGNQLLGPHFFAGNLNGDMYLQFLQNDLPELLEDVPLQTRRRMWFLHDGATPHYARVVTDFLNTMFPNRWIGRNGAVHWPARSPDLTPLDFYLWGHVKTLVYGRSKPNTRQELVERIQQAFDTVRGSMENVNWVGDLRRRAELCVEVEGAHFEQL